MKHFIATILCLFAFVATAEAQHSSNNNPDSIVGTYLTDRGGSKSKVRVTKNADGTYNAQVYWVENPYDKNGNKRKSVEVVADEVYFADSKRTSGNNSSRDEALPFDFSGGNAFSEIEDEDDGNLPF